MQLDDFGAVAPTIRISGDAALADGGWADEAKAALAEAGAVLLRGPVTGDNGAELALSKIDDDLLDDAFWSTPRSKVGGKTLTATEYPSPRTIALHSEMAYMKSWPRYVSFHSLLVADTGGETTVCDVEKVSKKLGERKLKPFREKGVMYRRTFSPNIDIAWQQAFQTDRREDVEEMGRRLGMTVEWFDGDVLVTTHVAQGTIQTEDDRTLYFNQSHLFHSSLLDANVRATLEKLHGPGRLPRQSFYGDGKEIDDDVIDAVYAAFDTYQTGMRWQEGDILILDNMRYAHGRLPFSGKRRLHVSLAHLEDRPQRTPLSATRSMAA